VSCTTYPTLTAGSDATSEQSLTGGKQNSPEPPSQNIHVVWNVTFASSSDRDYYVKEDPAHRAFVQDVCMQAIDVDKVIVLDFDSDEFTA
jgi:hypothetical protein